jgi:HAMP domain-containing protein
MGLYIGTIHLSRPIKKVTEAIKNVADGNFDADVPFAGRKDEIGEMAAAVRVQGKWPGCARTECAGKRAARQER